MQNSRVLYCWPCPSSVDCAPQLGQSDVRERGPRAKHFHNGLAQNCRRSHPGPFFPAPGLHRYYTMELFGDRLSRECFV